MTASILDEAQLLAELEAGVVKAWREFREAEPDAHPYCVAIIDAIEHGHCEVAVFTEEHLDREIEELIARSDFFSPYAAQPSFREQIRWNRSSCMDFDVWVQVWETRDFDHLPEAEYDALHDEVMAHAYRCAIKVLQDLDRRGLFGPDRDEITLLVLHHAGESLANVVSELVTLLNPPAVVARWRSMDWGYRGEMRREAASGPGQWVHGAAGWSDIGVEKDDGRAFGKWTPRAPVHGIDELVRAARGGLGRARPLELTVRDGRRIGAVGDHDVDVLVSHEPLSLVGRVGDTPVELRLADSRDHVVGVVGGSPRRLLLESVDLSDTPSFMLGDREVITRRDEPELFLSGTHRDEATGIAAALLLLEVP